LASENFLNIFLSQCLFCQPCICEPHNTHHVIVHNSICHGFP
jgi:hypothetical protein